jgi:3-hydroxymyristoyl/3-hydroxydecanoyl-(acyl carrier protein) dehydratase
MLRMVERIELFEPAGGPSGLGLIRGATPVDPLAWFFRAHFLDDPVWPGSLGLESFWQLLQVAAARRFGRLPGRHDAGTTLFESPAVGVEHSWVYRGQILPTHREVTAQAVVTSIDERERLLRADGHLFVDGRVIYQVNDFAVRMIDP